MLNDTLYVATARSVAAVTPPNTPTLAAPVEPALCAHTPYFILYDTTVRTYGVSHSEERGVCMPCLQEQSDEGHTLKFEPSSKVLAAMFNVRAPSIPSVYPWVTVTIQG